MHPFRCLIYTSSGSGKSTLLRVIAGLTPMDDGDVTVNEISLADCFHSTDHHGHNPNCYNMTNWRQRVRYVTQYKVDIPGTVSIVLDSSYVFECGVGLVSFSSS